MITLNNPSDDHPEHDAPDPRQLCRDAYWLLSVYQLRNSERASIKPPMTARASPLSSRWNLIAASSLSV
jgi:hypothetical protein